MIMGFKRSFKRLSLKLDFINLNGLRKLHQVLYRF